MLFKYNLKRWLFKTGCIWFLINKFYVNLISTTSLLSVVCVIINYKTILTKYLKYSFKWWSISPFSDKGLEFEMV